MSTFRAIRHSLFVVLTLILTLSPILPAAGSTTLVHAAGDVEADPKSTGTGPGWAESAPVPAAAWAAASEPMSAAPDRLYGPQPHPALSAHRPASPHRQSARARAVVGARVGGARVAASALTAVDSITPTISIHPATIEETMPADSSRVVSLTIANAGDSDLVWHASTVDRGTTLQMAERANTVTLPAPGVAIPSPRAKLAPPARARPDGKVTIQRRGSFLNSGPRVLLVVADDDVDFGSPMQGFLQAYGDLDTVDLFDAIDGTPTLAELQAYDVVVTWSSYHYDDRVAMGNVLANYVDTGGGVVVLQYALHGYTMQGRFMTEDYIPLRGTGHTWNPSCLGSYDADHPIMQGVTTVCEPNRVTGTYLTADATAVARWQDGNIFVAVKDQLPVIALNAYVGVYYEWTGQMADVLHNSILSLMGFWLSVMPEAGTVPGHSSMPVTVTLDTTDLISATYLADIVIESNDPLTPVVTVPVTMHVTGQPATVVTPALLDFGQVYAGYTRTLQLLVENAGTADLVVSGMVASDPALSASPASFIVPTQATGQVVTITYAPPLSATLAATLAITTNDPVSPVRMVPVVGRAVAPPTIGVSPTHFEEAMAAGMTRILTLTISNHGPTDLVWDTFVPPYSVSLPASQAAGMETSPPGNTLNGRPRVLLAIADYDNLWGSPMQGFLQAYGDLETVDLFNANTGTPTLAQLEAYDVVVTWRNMAYANATAMGDVLADYVDRGGRVVVLVFAVSGGLQGRFMTENYTPLKGSGNTQSTSCLGSYDADHPIMAGVTAVCDYYRLAGSYLTPDATAVAHWQDGNIFVGVKDQLPVVALGAFVGYNYRWTGQMADVVHNSILYLLQSWLTVTPEAGTVPAYSSMPVSVTLDTTHLVSDTYLADIVIESNDPVTPQVTVPLTLTVGGAPSAQVTPTLLDYGQVYAGYTHTLQILVENEGRADLVVSGIASSDPALSAAPASFVVPAYAGGQVVNVTYAPPASATLAATLTLTTNDPILPVRTVLVVGRAVDPPVIGVAPEAFEETVSAGDVFTRALAINNSGGSELTWALQGATDYIVRSSNDPDGPAFNWIEIRGSGTPIPGLDDDTYAGPFDLGFAFDFYGVQQTQYYVSGNGFLSFGEGASAHQAQCPLPDPTPPNNLIALLWDHLSSDYVSGGVFRQTFGSCPIYRGRCTVVEFYRWNHWGGHAAGTFEAILFDSGAIVIQFADAGLESGLYSTTGIEGPEGSQGLAFACREPILTDELAVSFSRLPLWLHAAPRSGAIPPGEGDLVTVTFDSSGLISGTYSAGLLIDSNDPVTPQATIPVTLHFTGRPAAAVTPTSLDYGQVFAGYTYPLQLLVENEGTADLVVSGIVASDPSLSASPSSFVVPGSGGSQGVTVSYTPPVSSPLTATLAITTNDPVTPVWSVAVIGRAVDPPVIAVEPASFEQSLPPDVTQALTLTISNAGGSELAFDLSGTYPQWLSLTPEAGTVPASASVLVTVTLDTTGLISGTYYGAAVIGSNDPVTPLLTVPLTLHVTGAPAAVVTPTSLDYGQVFAGYPHPLQLLVENEGTTELVVSGIVASDPSLSASPASFVVPALASGQVVIVTYAPPVSDSLTATLTLTTNDPVTPVWSVAVIGRAVDPPIIAVSPTRIEETLSAGTTRGMTLTVTNSGGSDLAFEISNLAPWLNIPQPTGIVPAHSSAPATVILQATDLVSGTYYADLQVRSNDPVTPEVTIPVTMHVTGKPDASIDLLIDFGDVFFTYPHTRSLLIENAGAADLVVSDIHSDNPIVIALPDHLIVPALESGDVDIIATPALKGPFSATLTVSSNDPVSPVINVEVVGTAVYTPAIRISPTAFDVVVETGQVTTRTLLVNNDGLGTLHFVLDAQNDLVAMDPLGGAIVELGQMPVTVTFDATTLLDGKYTERIDVASNDPAQPLISIPVSLTVILLPPGVPSLVSPLDGEVNVRIDKMLQWQASPRATTYDLYLWPDGTSKPGTPAQSGLTLPYYDPPYTFETLTTYHWQVMALNAAGSTAGPEWTFTTETLPDLEVTAVTVPPSGFAGQPVEVSWIVINNGERGTTLPTWYDRVYLSPSPVFDLATATRLGDRINPAYLGPGESYLNTATFNLPQGTEGDYYVFVRANAQGVMREADQTNNVGRSDTAIDISLPPLPDLQVSGVSGPANAFSGDRILVNWTVRNEGAGATGVGYWFDAIYLAVTTTLDVDDAYLLRTVYHSGDLGSGQAYTLTIPVTLPQAIYGAWYLFVATDMSNRVYEHVWESNNTGGPSGPLHITLTPPPDFQVTSLSAPATANSGADIRVQWTVTNLGAGAPFEPLWYDRVYLSPDPVLVVDDAWVLGTFGVGEALAPGDLYTRTRDLTVPDGISGIHYLHVWTDWDGRVFEYMDDDNNVTATTLSIALSPSPDLQVSSVSVDASGTAGTLFHLSWSVLNDGNAPANPVWRDRVVLSTDIYPSAGDIFLGIYEHQAGLPVGQVYTETRTVILPDALAGTYYVLVLTDSTMDLYEHEGEDNNVGQSPAVPIAARPDTDLVLGGLSAPATGSSGQPMIITWAVTNTGTIATGVSSWTDAAYLSADTTLNKSTDRLVDSWTRSGRLPAGEAYTRIEMPNLPDGLEGEFYLFLVVDTQGLVDDPDRANNVGYATPPIVVTLSPSPDLQPAAVNPPADAFSGQPLAVEWAVHNGGPGNARAPWYDAFYLSADPVASAGDLQLLSQRHLGDLASGATYTATASPEIPRWAAGQYYLLLKADSRDEVYEGLAENNNVTAWPVNVTMPPPSDLVVISVTVPSTAIPGEAITIDWTIQNQGVYPAIGRMCDAVYISPDATWDLADAFVANKCQNINLAPGETGLVEVEAVMPDYEVLANLSGSLPGVTPGTYYAIVRTDVLNQIRESNDGNNIGISQDTISVDVTALTLDVPVEDVLTTGTSHFYRLDVPAGETLIVTLDGNLATASDELYVRYGGVPSRGNFDFGYTRPFEEDQEVYVPFTRGGTYYILVYGADVPGGPAGYSLIARIPAFSVLNVNAEKVGNAGQSTLEIQGARFGRDTTFQVISPDGVVLDAGSVIVRDASTAFAAFDFTGQTPGLYDVRATREGGMVALLEDAFPVTVGTGPQFVVRFVAPSSIGLNRNYLLYIDYGNIGDADLVSPMLVAYNTTDTPAGFSLDSMTPGQVLQLLAVSRDGPAGILRAGEYHRIPVYFYTSTPRVSFELFSVDNNDPRLINWPEVESMHRPAGIPEEEWATIWANIQARVGTTWGDYAATLAQIATRLSERGEVTFAVRDLFAELVRQEAGVGYSVIAGMLINLDSGQLIDEAVVVARYEQDADTTFIEADMTDDAGQFSIDELVPGRYDIYAEGYYFDETPTFTVTQETDVLGATLYAHTVPPPEPVEPVYYEVSDSDPALAVDDSGDVHLVWQRDEEVWHSVYSGGAWAQTAPISHATGTVPDVTFDPALIGGADPGLAVVWQSGFGNDATLHYAVGQAGAGSEYTWSVPLTLTSDSYGDSLPVLAVTPGGDLVILWLQQDWDIEDDQDLYYALVEAASIPLQWPSLPPDRGISSSIPIPDGAAIDAQCISVDLSVGENVPLPFVGGKYGITISGQACGESGCDGASVSGQLSAKAKLGDNVEGSGGASASAKWLIDKGACQYVFNSAEASAFVGLVGQIPLAMVPIFWPDIRFGVQVEGQVAGTLGWQAANWPGWPSDGYVSVQAGLGPYGKVVFVEDKAEAAITGIGSVTIGWRPPTQMRLECAEFKLSAEAKLCLLSYSWSKSWKAGPCAAGMSALLLDTIPVPTDDTIVIHDTTQGDSLLSESLTIIRVEPYTGTGAIYEGTPVLSDTISTDVRHDGAPAIARSSSGELLAAWTKDSSDWNTAVGSSVVVAEFTGSTWDAPIEIQPADHFGRNPALVFAGPSGDTPVLLWPSAPATVTLSSPVTDVVEAIAKTDILFSTRAGDNWTAPAPVAGLPGEDTSVRTAVDGAGQVIAAWLNTNDEIETLYTSIWDGSNWSVLSTIPVTSPVGTLDLAATGGTTPLLVWSQEYTSTQTGDYVQSLYYATWNGSAWSAPARFTKPAIEVITGLGGEANTSLSLPRTLSCQDVPLDDGVTNLAAPDVGGSVATLADVPPRFEPLSGSALSAPASVQAGAGSGTAGMGTTTESPGSISQQPAPTSTPAPPRASAPTPAPTGTPSATRDEARVVVPVSTPQPPRDSNHNAGTGVQGFFAPPPGCCETETPTPTATPTSTGEPTPTASPTSETPTPTVTPSPDATYEAVVITAHDPNDILGPEGFGDAHWMAVDGTFDYTIRYENDPLLASAPAQRVLITQTLDVDLDPRTFRLGAFGFGDHLLTEPDNRSFYSARLGPFIIMTTVPTTHTFSLYVDVNAGIDVVSGEAFWIFQSIDPATGAPPVDATVGFLPPNTSSGTGEGFVTYRIRPDASAQTGDVVDAWARIFFDVNDPIDTRAIFNTLDAAAPTSAVNPLLPETAGAEVVLTWLSSDDVAGSGVRDVDLYVSSDGGPFALWRAGVPLTATVFAGESGHTYGFFAIANDGAGNREPMKTAAEAVTLLFMPGAPARLNVTADPTLIPPDGTSTSVISTTVRNGRGDLLPAQTINLTSTLGTLSSITAMTDVSGTAAVTLTAGLSPGTAVVTVMTSGALGEIVATTAVTIEEAIAGLTAVNNSPTALGYSTTLTASIAAGSHVTYAWSLGDGAATTGAVVVHTYPAPGIYTALVTATNAVNVLTATTGVTVEEAVAGLAVTSDSPTPLGAATTLTATLDAGSSVSYTWAFGDGTTPITTTATLTNGVVLTHTYPALGVYTTVVTASNDVSLLTATTTVTITNEPIAGLAAINDSPTPLGSATTLTATVGTGSNVTYTWVFGDGESGSGAVVTHTYPEIGLYTAVVTAANSTNELTATTAVTITDVPIAGLVAVNDSPTPLGSATTLTATVGNGSNVTYTWALGDGGAGHGGVVTHTYPLTGVYTAVVTAANSTNELTATTTVTVSNEPITGLVATNDSPTGLGSATHLTATVATGMGVTYTWDLGDGAQAGGASVAHIYPEIGIYTAVVTAVNNFDEMTATTKVTVTEVPIAGLVATNDSPTAFGEPTTFTATVAAGSHVTFTWAFGDGELAIRALVTHTYPATGTFTAVVTALNSVSTLTATTPVTVTAPPPACPQPVAAVRVTGPTMGMTTTTPYTFTAIISPADATAPITYTWAPEPDSGQGTPGASYSWATTGVFSVAAAVENCGGSASDMHLLLVGPGALAEVDPASGGTLVYTDTQGLTTTVDVPPNAVADLLTLVYIPVDAVVPSPGFSFAGHAVDLDAYRNGILLPSLDLTIPVLVTIHYSDADVMDIKENSLLLGNWDGDTWVDAACDAYDRDLGKNWLTAPICHLSRFALLGETAHYVYLPLVLRHTP
ncbi:MAG: PKD domain-containing protein [Anaerolineae bacterium]|nr:PKD domain-containing protein [Anaerolineae bacterium]